MKDRNALIRSILESPLDDTPRLIFADWLDEHGEAERAEFIRAGIDSTRFNPSSLPPGENLEEQFRLDAVERDLFEKHKCHFFDERLAVYYLWQDAGDMGQYPVEAVVTRGFISSLRCSWGNFLRHHESLIWSPKQTMECPECGGSGSRDSGGTNPWGEPVDIACGCDGGRIPRPFVATAQPITDAVLTTWPGNRHSAYSIQLTDADGDLVQRTIQRVKCSQCNGNGRGEMLGRCRPCDGTGYDPLDSWTCPAWPGVKFSMSE